MPPFEPGLFITDLSETHSLLFNKFPICNEHTVVITKEMERQDAPMTERDFEAILISLQSLDAFAYFNRGFLSGMSLLHKHFQLIPFSAMGDKCTRLPVEAAFFNSGTSFNGVTKFEGFSGIEHCVKVFADDVNDSLEMPRDVRSLNE